MTRILAGAVIAALSFVAAATPAFAQSGESAVRGAIESLVPNAKIDSVSESVVPNLYEVTIEGRVVYVTADGRYLIQGSLFDIPNRVDITEASRAKREQSICRWLGNDLKVIDVHLAVVLVRCVRNRSCIEIEFEIVRSSGCHGQRLIEALSAITPRPEHAYAAGGNVGHVNVETRGPELREHRVAVDVNRRRVVHVEIDQLRAAGQKAEAAVGSR